MQFSKIILGLTCLMATMVSAAAVPNDDLIARCTTCKKDDDCNDGSPFPPTCKSGCCTEN